jgi:carboxylesterase type B
MACHAFDIPYMFRPQFLWLSKKEKQLSKQYIKYVVNFMNGNINKDVAVKWPVYSADQKEYLELSHECKVGKRLREQLCRDVWAKIGYKF